MTYIFFFPLRLYPWFLAFCPSSFILSLSPLELIHHWEKGATRRALLRLRCISHRGIPPSASSSSSLPSSLSLSLPHTTSKASIGSSRIVVYTVDETYTTRTGRGGSRDFLLIYDSINKESVREGPRQKSASRRRRRRRHRPILVVVTRRASPASKLLFTRCSFFFLS